MNANKYIMTSTKGTRERTKFMAAWRNYETNTSWLKRWSEPFRTFDALIFQSNYLSCLHALIFFSLLFAPSIISPSIRMMKSFKRTHFIKHFIQLHTVSQMVVCSDRRNVFNMNHLKSLISLKFNNKMKSQKKSVGEFFTWREVKSMAPWELVLKGCNFNIFLFKNASYFNALRANCSIDVIKFCDVSKTDFWGQEHFSVCPFAAWLINIVLGALWIKADH